MAKPRKAWNIRPWKSPRPSVPDSIKAELEAKATDLIENVLKPEHVLPPKQDEKFNYIADKGARWRMSVQAIGCFELTYRVQGIS